MEDKIVVAVDAMGGDNAPYEIVKGCVEAVAQQPNIFVKLVGPEETVKAELQKFGADNPNIEIVNATEVISCDEAPVNAIRRKKDSSIVVGCNLVKKGEADAFLSAGSTGAVLVGGQLIVGRIKGVERPPIGTMFPTAKGVSLLVDSGANVDARSSHLVQFAKMGSIYFANTTGVEKPRVAIVNIGLEEEKGNQLVKETYPLLKECKDINFIGSIEAREIPNGYADVIVCEGFVGNVILKLYEGTTKALIGIVKQSFYSNLKSKIGGLLVKPALKKTLKKLMADEYGSAPLLGLNGLVLKTHGSATAKEVKNSLLQALDFKKQKINEKIKDSIMLDDSPEE
ncbi:MAG: phosphate acyltransferase PlsX [Lachnospiraceae bacterium]|nr:phosphate acyltransferase PlsX [Lachnospiraceae bacterium]